MSLSDLVTVKSITASHQVPSEYANLWKVYGPEIAKAVAEYQGKVRKLDSNSHLWGSNVAYAPLDSDDSDFNR